MRIVVTGAAGFIGSNLVYELVKQRHDVIGIDNLSTGLLGNVRQNRFSDLRGLFRFVEKDINDSDLDRYFDGCDVCLHLAALAKVQFSTDHPLKANQANITGTLNVLESAKKAGLKRVVFSSSSSVYGGADINFPTKETEKLTPRSNYALQKLTGEHYCRLYGELYGFDTICLRYFNAIGRGSRLGGAYSAVIPAFMDKAVNGGEIKINGDGNVVRDFCPCENIVQANILAAEHPNKLNGECFNIALGETHTINEVYDRICSLAGKTIPKTNGPHRKGDPMKSFADITKAKEILGYNPSVSFEESLVKTYDWWKNGCKI